MNKKSSFKALPGQAQVAIVAFGLAGAAAAAAAWILQAEWHLMTTLVLVAIGIATARAKVTLTGTSSVSLLTSTVLLSLMVGGPGVAVLVAVCGVLTQTILPAKKLVWHQLLFNSGMIAVTVAAAALAFQMSAGVESSGFAQQFIGAIIASLAYFFGNSASMALIIGLAKGISVVRMWREHMLCTAPSFLIAGVLSLAMVELYATPAVGVTLAAVPLAYPIYYVSLKLR